MPTTVAARSVTQEIKEAGAPVVQAIFSDRESLRGIEGVAEMILQASRKRGRKIKRPTIPGLVANTSAVTSTGNNQGFDPVFATKAEPFARPGDVLIAISASGDSCKILPAVLITGALRLKAIAWTGGTGGNVEKKPWTFALAHRRAKRRASSKHTFWRDKRFRNSSNGDRSSDEETRYGS